jgi:hypothetical protein
VAPTPEPPTTDERLSEDDQVSKKEDVVLMARLNATKGWGNRRPTVHENRAPAQHGSAGDLSPEAQPTQPFCLASAFFPTAIAEACVRVAASIRLLRTL